MNISRQIYIARLKSHPVECLAEVYKEKADVLSHTGEYCVATEVYARAKSLYFGLRKKYKCGEIDYQMGNVLENKGSFQEAEECFHRALAIFTECSREFDIAKCYREIGKIYQYREDPDNAILFYMKAREIYQKACDNKGLHVIMEYLADVYRSRGDYKKALDEVDHLQKIYYNSDDIGTLCRVSKLAGRIYMQQGENEKARSFLTTAYQYTKKNGENSMAMYILGDLGLVCYNEGDYQAACTHFEECCALAEKMDSTYVKAVNMVNMADALMQMGCFERSRGYISQAETIKHNIGGLNSEIERIKKEIAQKEGDQKETRKEKSS